MTITTTTRNAQTTMREIPPLMRERLIRAGQACQAAPDHEKGPHIRAIDQITDELARAGIVHARHVDRPEFGTASGIRKQR